MKVRLRGISLTGSAASSINGWNLTPDLAGPVEMRCRLAQPSQHLLHVRRMPCRKLKLEGTAGSESPDETQIPDLRFQNACFSLGKHAVVIKSNVS